MTMTVPVQTESINIVQIRDFAVSVKDQKLVIIFDYGYKDAGNNITEVKSGHVVLDSTKYNQLLNATPPGNKTFRQWIRPLLYTEIADYLGVPVGQID